MKHWIIEKFFFLTAIIFVNNLSNGALYIYILEIALYIAPVILYT